MTNTTNTGDPQTGDRADDAANEHSPLLPTTSNSSGTLPSPSSKRGWSLRSFIGPKRLLIPVFLVFLSLVFFTTSLTVSLNSCSIPPDQTEAISNLTSKLHHCRNDFGLCDTNRKTLQSTLDTEQHRLAACRTSEKRLADRVETAESQLNTCRVKQVELKDELKDVKGREEQCQKENDDLRRQVEKEAFIEFGKFVGSLGTGGDSWVCSDTTLSWSFGYVSEASPNPTITIATWTAELTDAQHSTEPLVFPPPPPAMSPEVPSHDPSTSSLNASKARIIGYTVTSRNISGNNGWWKIGAFEKFGVLGGKIEFLALAGKWYGSKALFDVKVWYVDG